MGETELTSPTHAHMFGLARSGCNLKPTQEVT